MILPKRFILISCITLVFSTIVQAQAMNFLPPDLDAQGTSNFQAAVGINEDADEDLIIGGALAPRGAYTWYVRISKASGQQWCGGSLVASNYVLTAAHCVENGVNGLNLQVGAMCLQSSTNCGQKVEIFTASSVITHPNYNNNGWNNDFALIKLNGKSTVPPVSIDNIDLSWGFSGGKRIRAAGFGASNPNGQVYPTELYHADLEYVSPNACKAKMGAGNMNDNMMCAIGDGQDSCYGDSGGPLFDTQSKKVVGLVSWGFGCAIPGMPTAYARVASQVEWIKGEVCSSDPPHPQFCGGKLIDLGCDNPKQALLEVDVRTDAYGKEDNSFKVFQLQNNGGIKKRRMLGINLESNEINTKTKCVNKSKCYKLIVYDNFGDGACCAYGKGYYQVKLDGQDVVPKTEFEGGFEQESIKFGNCNKQYL